MVSSPNLSFLKVKIHFVNEFIPPLSLSLRSCRPLGSLAFLRRRQAFVLSPLLLGEGWGEGYGKPHFSERLFIQKELELRHEDDEAMGTHFDLLFLGLRLF